jgi:hypothetical protein
MVDSFEVKLEPFTVEKTVGNLTVTQSLNQDRVVIVTNTGQRCWGYCSTLKGCEIFLPLSGFPKELVAEVQRQINALKGYPEGEGPNAAVVIETGRTAGEQAADADDTEVYEYELIDEEDNE